MSQPSSTKEAMKAYLEEVKLWVASLHAYVEALDETDDDSETPKPPRPPAPPQ